jgi:hypothetical protein
MGFLEVRKFIFKYIPIWLHFLYILDLVLVLGSISLSRIKFLDSSKVALFGVPPDRYEYMSDGTVYPNYNAMMAHVETLAQEHGQQGSIP